jgi:hypothetical protein
MNIRTSIFTLTFGLVAGIGCVADQAPVSDGNDSANLEIELAQPQPDVPLCSRCSLGKAGGFTSGDDELSIDIDNSYNGNVSGVMLTTWTSAGIPSYHYFGSSVISDINDPYTEITLLYVEAPAAVSAQLTWTYTGGTQLNSITVFNL